MSILDPDVTPDDHAPVPGAPSWESAPLGKRATAPCGCPGTYIVGTFIRCDRDCARWRAGLGPPDPTRKREPTEWCPSCGSDNIESFTPYFGLPPMRHCVGCGKVFQ